MSNTWSADAREQQVLESLNKWVCNNNAWYHGALQAEHFAVDIDWSDGGRVHNWRTHVPDIIADVWSSLPMDARACVYVMAMIEAGNEHWD